MLTITITIDDVLAALKYVAVFAGGVAVTFALFAYWASKIRFF